MVIRKGSASLARTVGQSAEDQSAEESLDGTESLDESDDEFKRFGCNAKGFLHPLCLFAVIVLVQIGLAQYNNSITLQAQNQRYHDTLQALEGCKSYNYVNSENSYKFQMKACECGGNGGVGGEVGCCCPATQPNSQACCVGAAQAAGHIPLPHLCTGEVCESQLVAVTAQFTSVHAKCSSRLLRHNNNTTHSAFGSREPALEKGGANVSEVEGRENDNRSNLLVTIISWFFTGVVIIICVIIIIWQCRRWVRRAHRNRLEDGCTFTVQEEFNACHLDRGYMTLTVGQTGKVELEMSSLRYVRINGLEGNFRIPKKDFSKLRQHGDLPDCLIRLIRSICPKPSTMSILDEHSDSS